MGMLDSPRGSSLGSLPLILVHVHRFQHIAERAGSPTRTHASTRAKRGLLQASRITIMYARRCCCSERCRKQSSLSSVENNMESGGAEIEASSTSAAHYYYLPSSFRARQSPTKGLVLPTANARGRSVRPSSLFEACRQTQHMNIYPLPPRMNYFYTRLAPSGDCRSPGLCLSSQLIPGFTCRCGRTTSEVTKAALDSNLAVRVSTHLRLKQT